MTSAASTGAVDPMWTLADRLRKAREFAGLTQGELADEVGISRRSVSTYESGAQTPNRPVVLSWAMRCNVRMEWLVGDDGPKPGHRRRPRRDSNAGPVAYNNTGSRPLILLTNAA